MATLKEHQAAMVDLLANGSGIPASASRLAHAMHDVLVIVNNLPFVRPAVECGEGGLPERPFLKRPDATTPGLNDKALSKREKALKTDSPAKWPTPAEQRVKELENTIRQLKANNAKLKRERDELRIQLESAEDEIIGQEQAGCRKEDTQAWEPECDHAYAYINMNNRTLECGRCGHNVPGPEGFNPNPSKATV